MSHINLLPWREKLRERQKQAYLALLGGASVVMVLVVLGIGEFLDTMINNQKVRNQFLEKEIAIVDTKIGQIATIKQQKENIEKRISLIQQLQEHRNVSPVVLDELAKIVPSGITFRKLVRKENAIELQGVSESNNRLSEFMRRLDNSKVFISSEISSVRADTSTSEAISEFRLSFMISPTIAPPLVSLEEVEQAK
ncbi:PilN domain-containing protein [Planctobacterium marinum]|uniref:Pilus assembly protein PilN n=1 Tax=Planctobacterium marinum TaxID=1631968 RepID=A0AA48I940_9ALTE|nr:pilus assembly protein PilN [Planctobacterium marinum]